MTGRNRRAARAVIVAAVAFVAGQAGLSAALETVRPEWRDPEYGWRLKAVRQLDRTRGTRPLILAFGSSRTQMGLSPHDLGDAAPLVYNFGLSGSGPIQIWLNLKRVLDAGVKPNAVLVEIMPATLAYRGTSETLFHDTVARLGSCDLDRLSAYGHSLAFRERWLSNRLVPWYSQRFLLLSHWQPTLLHWKQRIDFQWRLMDSRGWARFPFESIDDGFRAEQTAHTREQYESKLRKWEVSEIADRILRDIAGLCKREGIALAFYLMPEANSFRDWSGSTGRIKLTTYLGGLSNELNVPVFDASTWLPDDAFTDGHHLLPSGARQFSARFGREVLGQWPPGK